MSACSGAGAAGWAACRVRNSDTSGKVDGGRLAAAAAVGASLVGAGPRSPDERGTTLASASRCTPAGETVDASVGGFGDARGAGSTGALPAIGGTSSTDAAR